MKKTIGNSNPIIWSLQILLGFILQYGIGGGLLGTIGVILALVGIGNASYFVYKTMKTNHLLKIVTSVIAFILFLAAYASIGVIIFPPVEVQ